MSRNKQRNKELSLTSVEGRLSLFLDKNTPDELLKAIVALGVKPIMLPPYARLPSPVACHPDMLLFDMGGKLLMYRDYYEENQALFDGFSVALTHHIADTVYPYDVGMDALCLGNVVYCKPTYTCSEIIKDRMVVTVKQGYAACSALKVTEDAIVTADQGIADAAKKMGVSVLLIRPGYIDLPGYDYGFIGGTAFRLFDTMYFAGDLVLHPDGEAIANFCQANGISVCSLVKGMKLKDLGFMKENTTNG